jgi:hypothetical protein
LRAARRERRSDDGISTNEHAELVVDPLGSGSHACGKAHGGWWVGVLYVVLMTVGAIL